METSCDCSNIDTVMSTRFISLPLESTGEFEIPPTLVAELELFLSRSGELDVSPLTPPGENVALLRGKASSRELDTRPLDIAALLVGAKLS